MKVIGIIIRKILYDPHAILKPGFHMIVPGRSYGNATQTIANDPDRFKIYTIVPIVRIELDSIQAIEVVSVVRVVCDRLGSVSI